MSELEQDKLITEKLMGWELMASKSRPAITIWWDGEGAWSGTDTKEVRESIGNLSDDYYWSPSNRLEDCYKVEERVKELGLIDKYIYELYFVLLQSQDTLFIDDISLIGQKVVSYFSYTHATSKQRAQALANLCTKI